jgi:hypothetical protein
VEELHAVTARLRAQRGEEPAGLVAQLGLRPASGGSRVGIELVDGDLCRIQRDQVVVAGQREICALRDDGRRLIRVRPVADRVAEAPELVDALVLDRVEYGR